MAFAGQQDKKPRSNVVRASVGLGPADAGLLWDLQPGQLVRGSVLQRLPDGDWLVGMLGLDLRASSDLALVAGEDYDFLVQEPAPALVLSLPERTADPAPAAARRASCLGPSGRALAERLAALPEACRAAGLAGLLDAAAPVPSLAELGPRLGLDYEQRLLGRDGDGAGPGLRPALWQDARADGAAALSAALDELVRDQLRRRLLGLAESLPLPTSIRRGMQEARMFWLGERETLVLLLEVDGLGPLRAELKCSATGVALRLLLAVRERVYDLNQALPRLRALAASRGVDALAVSVHWAGPEGLPQRDLWLPGASSGEGMVDARA